MKIDLSEKELNIVLHVLDSYSRIFMGQYHVIISDLGLFEFNYDDETTNKVKSTLMTIRNEILPGLYHVGWNGSYGIYCPDVDYRAGVAYNMQQVFRNKMAYFKKPAGSFSVDHKDVLPVKSDPYPLATATCYKNGDMNCITISVNDEQCQIIKDAFKIQQYIVTGNLNTLFDYFTSNQDALVIAANLTDFIKSARIESAVDYAQLIAKF